MMPTSLSPRTHNLWHDSPRPKTRLVDVLDQHGAIQRESRQKTRGFRPIAGFLGASKLALSNVVGHRFHQMPQRSHTRTNRHIPRCPSS